MQLKKLIPGLLILSLFSCAHNGKSDMAISEIDPLEEKEKIAAMLDSFHVAAATADYNTYFDFFAGNGTFIGTDATEYWDKDSFMVWAKPYFDKKTTWNFRALKRNIYLDENNSVAWFDELLSTQMKICRGSGVVTSKDGEWKIEQYVLSMTIPNQTAREIISIKAPIEDSLIQVMEHR